RFAVGHGDRDRLAEALLGVDEEDRVRARRHREVLLRDRADRLAVEDRDRACDGDRVDREVRAACGRRSATTTTAATTTTTDDTAASTTATTATTGRDRRRAFVL